MPSSLTELRLHDNQLSGPLPDVSTLTALQYFYIWNNQLTGPLPDLSSLTALQQFSISHNTKLGTDPTAANGKTAIAGLAGKLPASSLTHLWLNYTGLSGDIPNLSSLTSLQHLYLDTNQLTGAIPNTLPTSLQSLILHANQLSGAIPNLSGLTSLTHLYLYNNALTGAIPNTLPTSLQSLLLHTNQLSGAIPDLSGLTSLRWLELYNNHLTGNLAGLSSLNPWALYLHDNRLSGEIPAFSNSDQDFRLSLYGNAGLYGYPAALNTKTKLRLLARGDGTAVCLPSTQGGSDCTVPTLVDDLHVQVRPTQLDFRWTPNPATPAPSGYTLEYYPPPDGPWTPVPPRHRRQPHHHRHHGPPHRPDPRGDLLLSGADRRHLHQPSVVLRRHPAHPRHAHESAGDGGRRQADPALDPTSGGDQL